MIYYDIMLYMISFDVKWGPCYLVPAMQTKRSKTETRDILLRDLPIHLADKIKVAATLHRTSMKDYILEILRKHVDELESRGVVLTLTGLKKKP